MPQQTAPPSTDPISMGPVSMNLGGRVALVTGASGGLGRHFALLLARAGAAVCLAARRADKLEAVRDAIRAAGGRAIAVATDITDQPSVAAAVAATVAQFGRLDILVNNAGISLAKPFLDLTEAEWDGVLDTDLKGCFLMAQAAARAMAADGGAIVNIASILGLRVTGHLAPYSAAKAGLVHLTQSMALELARHRIRVNALCPGYIETDMNRAFMASPAGQALIRRIPQRRLGQPEHLDGPLLLLCSDAGAYITGAVLAVDGGHLVNPL